VTAATVLELWRYPVKSMRGEALTAVALTERGLAGDRGFALVDRDTGKVASAKLPRRWGKLLDCRAELVAPLSPDQPPEIRITLPDGRALSTGTDDVEAALGELLGRDITLAIVPPDEPEIEREWPDIDGLNLRATETSGPIALGAPPGTFFDYAPLHLLTTGTLDHLRALYPEGRIDARRFRPNVLLATPPGVVGFIENDWVGRPLAIGDEVRLRVTNPSPRCVVPTLPQADLPRDLGILRAVVAHNRPAIPALDGVTQPSLGAYAVVERGGTIRRGDPVRLLDVS